MARILLLDDSPTMHRVVRLTFADDQRIEIAVARNRLEADQSLSAQQTDLIIAYVRFDGLTDSRYFETLRLVTPRILLLAESEENLDPFLRSGFSQVLRKPFHSDELRQVVESMLEKPSEVSLPAYPTESVRPRSAAEASVSHARPDLDLFAGDFDSESQVTQEISPQLIEPKITLDLSFLQQSLEPESKSPMHNQRSADKPASVPDRGSGQVAQPPPVPSRGSGQVVQPPPVPSRGSGQVVQPPPVPSRIPARGIEPAQMSDDTFAIEDVIVESKQGKASSQMQSADSMMTGGTSSISGGRVRDAAAGLSRQEVEKIVEDSIATAVNRAVRQALTETIPDLRQALVVEVSQRAVEQLSEELAAVKMTLREQMLSELRDVSAQWLRRETPNLAKDVIREEIRRVIEQI